MPEVTAQLFNVSETVTFTYEDALGKISSRIVTPGKVGPGYIVGYCHTREQPRTFSFSRMKNVNTSPIRMPVPAHLKW